MPALRKTLLARWRPAVCFLGGWLAVAPPVTPVRAAEPAEARVGAGPGSSLGANTGAVSVPLVSTEPRATRERETSFRFASGGGKSLTWEPGYRRFDWANVMVMGVGGAVALVGAIVGPDQNNPWRPVVGIDEDVRNALRSGNYDELQTWRDTSDVLLTLTFSYPFLGDALVNAAWYRRSSDVATEMVLIDAEALLVTLAFQQAAANFVGRERPYGRDCGTGELDEETDACIVDNRYRSFFSGHSAMSFAAASLTCTHGAYLSTYGGYEWAPCAIGYALAAGTALARVAGDMHYFTDIVTGAAIGAFTGWVVPWLHYNTGVRPLALRAGDTTVSILPTGTGFTAVGAF